MLIDRALFYLGTENQIKNRSLSFTTPPTTIAALFSSENGATSISEMKSLTPYEKSEVLTMSGSSFHISRTKKGSTGK